MSCALCSADCRKRDGRSLPRKGSRRAACGGFQRPGRGGRMGIYPHETFGRAYPVVLLGSEDGIRRHEVSDDRRGREFSRPRSSRLPMRALTAQPTSSDEYTAPPIVQLPAQRKGARRRFVIHVVAPAWTARSPGSARHPQAGTRLAPLASATKRARMLALPGRGGPPQFFGAPSERRETINGSRFYDRGSRTVIR
jgi:hypothetical protein